MRRRVSIVLAAPILLGFGCGTDVGDLLAPMAWSTASGAADILLSELALALDETLNPPPEPEPAPEPPVGNPDAGQVIFDSYNCWSCHCADATGGCANAAPSLWGANYALVDDKLRGPLSHTGGKFTQFTDFNIADLSAHFQNLASP